MKLEAERWCSSWTGPFFGGCHEKVHLDTHPHKVPESLWDSGRRSWTCKLETYLPQLWVYLQQLLFQVHKRVIALLKGHPIIQVGTERPTAQTGWLISGLGAHVRAVKTSTGSQLMGLVLSSSHTPWNYWNRIDCLHPVTIIKSILNWFKVLCAVPLQLIHWRRNTHNHNIVFVKNGHQKDFKDHYILLKFTSGTGAKSSPFSFV